MPLFGGVELSDAALTLVGTVVVSLVGAVVLLWRLQTDLYRERIAELQSEVRRLQRRLLRNGITLRRDDPNDDSETHTPLSDDP